jgi:dsDNA-specific endonuclease/ATPase MutS2
MPEQTETFSRIVEKLELLTTKLRDYKRENEKMRKELEEKKLKWDEQLTKYQEMELQMNVLKSRESDDAKTSKSVLEKKINEYIKEIDRCIALLGDDH